MRLLFCATNTHVDWYPRWDDIIVGAPQYAPTDVEADVGGAVYVYIQRRDIQWDNMKPTLLHGSRDSMFGLVVASAGDVNHDGYNGSMHRCLLSPITFHTQSISIKSTRNCSCTINGVNLSITMHRHLMACNQITIF